MRNVLVYFIHLELPVFYVCSFCPLCMRRECTESTVLANQLLILLVGALLNPSSESSYCALSGRFHPLSILREAGHNCHAVLDAFFKKGYYPYFTSYSYFLTPTWELLWDNLGKPLWIWFSLLWFGLWLFHTLISSKMILCSRNSTGSLVFSWHPF